MLNAPKLFTVTRTTTVNKGNKFRRTDKFELIFYSFEKMTHTVHTVQISTKQNKIGQDLRLLERIRQSIEMKVKIQKLEPNQK